MYQHTYRDSARTVEITVTAVSFHLQTDTNTHKHHMQCAKHTAIIQPWKYQKSGDSTNHCKGCWFWLTNTHTCHIQCAKNICWHNTGLYVTKIGFKHLLLHHLEWTWTPPGLLTVQAADLEFTWNLPGLHGLYLEFTWIPRKQVGECKVLQVLPESQLDP